MLRIINQDRVASRLAPLELGGKISRAARAHSFDMAKRRYLSHVNPAGASPFDRMAKFGIRYREAGENIGFQQGTDQISMLRSIEQAMLHSRAHRANLLRPSFKRVGIGIVVAGDRLYVTQDFAG